ncbi:MAG: DUF4115 domain-containing protein, partial [Gammaproteobacteria bacterium]
MVDKQESVNETETPAAESLTPGPGAMLKERRRERGFSVVQVAGELHVHPGLVESLEHDRYEELGAPIFVKGHLRNYARLLGLDPEEIVVAYEAFADPRHPELLALGAGRTRPSISSTAWVSIVSWLVVIALIGLLGVWIYHRGPQVLQSADHNATTEQQPVTLPRPAAPEAQDGDLQSSGQANASAGDAAGPDQPSNAQSGQAESKTPHEGPNATLGYPAIQTQDAPADKHETPSQGSVETARSASESTPDAAPPIKVTLTFSDASWVEAYDADGRRLAYDLFDAGSARTVSGRP